MFLKVNISGCITLLQSGALTHFHQTNSKETGEAALNPDADPKKTGGKKKKKWFQQAFCGGTGGGLVLWAFYNAPAPTGYAAGHSKPITTRAPEANESGMGYTYVHCYYVASNGLSGDVLVFDGISQFLLKKKFTIQTFEKTCPQAYKKKVNERI